MRRVFLLYFLWIVCLITPGLGRTEQPWGALKEFVEDERPNYAMDFLIRGEPLWYFVSEEISPEEEAIIIKNFQKWPQKILQHIEKAGREKEFKDIIPLLRRPLILKKRLGVDITFGIKEEGFCGENAAGCFISKKRLIAVVEPYRKYFERITLHEIGHFFGLADQYEAARDNSHAEYSSDVNKEYGSVMLTLGKITCDDADGFINVLDLRLAQYNKGKFSKRARKGWKSLCPKSTNFYQKAMTITRKNMDILHDDNFHVILRTYHQGRHEGSIFVDMPDTDLLFDIAKKDIVRHDQKTGLVFSIKTPVQVYNSTKTQRLAGENLPIYEPSEQKLLWERSFTYLPKEKNKEGQIYVPILVTDHLGDFEVARTIIEIYENGNLKSSDRRIKIKGSKYDGFKDSQEIEIYATINNRTFEEFLVRQDYDSLKVEKGASVFQAKIDGKSISGPIDTLPSGDSAAAAEFWNYYQAHKRNLESFYKNFYDPLFGATKVKRQIEEKIKTDFEKSVSQSLRK